VNTLDRPTPTYFILSVIIVCLEAACKYNDN